MDAFAVALGLVIRKYRRALGLTQEKLAEGAGLHPTYVSMVERGKSNVTVVALRAIGDVVGTPASALVAQAEHEVESHSEEGTGGSAES